MKKSLGSLFLVLAFCGAMGCGTTRLTWISDPEVQRVSNEIFAAELRPAGITSGDTQTFKSFLLFLRNKIDRELEVIWDKTLFIYNGEMQGGFMFEGISHKDRDKPKPPDILPPNGTFRKRIWPNSLVFFFVPERARFREGSWIHREMNPGQNGVYLTVKSGDQEIRERITLNISVKEM
ncbi:MAG: hypothetical protein JSV47_00655 [Deltaproteobacteria bacterium]|nr:MAG: hypothetical protein JSV47_00655 [Deltaproteobacteria bacterium]